MFGYFSLHLQDQRLKIKILVTQQLLMMTPALVRGSFLLQELGQPAEDPVFSSDGLRGEIFPVLNQEPEIDLVLL